VSAIDLIASIILKRPTGRGRKHQHMCADKAYDAADVREFVASEGCTAHIKVNPRRRSKGAQSSGGERPTNDGDISNSKFHPARRWMVERTISWLSKRRGLRTRWAKKAENWLSFVQLACAHILLDLAVLG